MNKPTSDTAEGLSVALKALLDQGFVFVRLDQVRLKEVGERPAQSDSTMERLLH
jgi:hypothetical protein